jgi:hypothetical protein
MCVKKKNISFMKWLRKSFALKVFFLCGKAVESFSPFAERILVSIATTSSDEFNQAQIR